MGEDAEGVLVDGNILVNALNCNCYLCFLDRTGNGSDLVIHTNNASNGEGKIKYVATIYLLLQPGHYDMLYTRLA
jgi:hypothetical protein